MPITIDKRQRKRLINFLFVAVLIILALVSDELVVKLIAGLLVVIYMAFIIFLRDSSKFKKTFSPDIDPNALYEPEAEVEENFGDSFQILTPTRPEVITADNYTPEKRIVERTTLKPPDLKERFEEIANEKLPKEIGHNEQFLFVLEKLLTVVKESYNAYTTIFFWYNKKNEKLSIEKYISGTNEISNRKFDLEDDILSKIVQSGEPELLSDISPAAEADVIRYYTTTQNIRSFVGVPLFYDKQLIAILALDSKIDDAFGIETIYSLGKFVRVITMLITIFEEKHSESVSQQRLKGILSLINPEKRIDNEVDLVSEIGNMVGQILQWDAFTFIYFKPLEQKFYTTKVVNNTSLKYVGHNLEIELQGTLAGKAILTGIPVKIDDTSASDYLRYSKVEDVSFDGSFLAVPLIYNGQNYGVLCFESLRKNSYSNNDVQFVKNAANIISYIIYSYSTQTLLKSYLAVDIETKVLNESTFRTLLKSDIYKAQAVKVAGALALIRIDDFLEQESLFEGNPFPKVLQAVNEMISQELTPLSILGRLSERVYAVHFFHSTTKDVFLWAEKLRVKIARKPIAVVSKQTTYTVSIGIASTTNKSDVDEVIYNAELALQKAIEGGGNKVRNIN
jgi:diguanylate cyclase (GGDEF)-like protein